MTHKPFTNLALGVAILHFPTCMLMLNAVLGQPLAAPIGVYEAALIVVTTALLLSHIRLCETLVMCRGVPKICALLTTTSIAYVMQPVQAVWIKVRVMLNFALMSRGNAPPLS